MFGAKKAGHSGSLDPLASGMLPLCFGEATKISSFLLDSDKGYIAQARLGIRTNTGDLEGEVIQSCAVPQLTVGEIEGVLKEFEGCIDQIPPMHSALKKDGKPLYQLARKGIEVERRVRAVSIRSIDLIGVELPVLTLKIVCSKGTYIRTLVEDIGISLGCGAHVRMLHRTHISTFSERSMWSMEELQNLRGQGFRILDRILLPPDNAVSGLPEIRLNPQQEKYFRAGRLVDLDEAHCESAHYAQQLYRVYTSQGLFTGLAEFDQNRRLKPRRVFNLRHDRREIPQH